VATGPGYVTAAAAERGANVIGTDFSAAVLAAATLRHPNVTFREADAEALPFPDASFDAVTINFGMRHFAHPERALAEAHRVLRPDGRLGFTDWAPSDSFRIVPRLIQQHGDPSVAMPTAPADRFGDPARCKEVVQAAGFLAPTIITLPIVQRIDDAEAYFETVLAGAGPRQGSPLRAQAPDNVVAIREAVLRELRSYQRDGVISLPMPAILIAAQRS
jgi:SAM-dependent methyltransferase